MSDTCILFCRCTAGIVPDEKLEQISEIINSMEADLFELHDLCAVSISETGFLSEINKKYDQKIVIACYPRAVENMLIQAGKPFSGFQVLNFRKLLPEDIRQKLKHDFLLAEGIANTKTIKSLLDVPAWFPVIDQDQCTACGQCARFCLFGVYQFQDKKLEVINPLNCKNLCPACGRTCPACAIIFPRLAENTSLSGENPGKIMMDIQGQKEDSLFRVLEQRNRNRRSILKSGVIQLAEKEREKALKKRKNN